MESMMEGLFWGTVVKKGEPTELEMEVGEMLNLTMATLGAKVGKERHVLICEVAGSSFVICSLTAGVCENAPLNLRFSVADEAKLRVEGGSGEVHITGYTMSPLHDEDMMPFGELGESDEEEDEDDEDESTDEEVRRNTLQNAMMGSAAKRKAITVGNGSAKKARMEDDDEEGETGAMSREFGELMQKHFFSQDVAADDDEDDEDFDEDEEEESDEDEDNDEEDAKHVAFGESEEDEDDSEEEEQAAPPKKKHVDSKVQRVQTPKKPATQSKTEAKKAEATPKQQTPASKGKAAPQTPATGAKKAFTCPDCNKGFAKEEGMLQHQKAVHKSA